MTASKFKKVRSFDLISNEKFIEQADISNLPLANNSTDVAIFCLSLMGTNYIDFLAEAARVLKVSGELIIAEVQSRSK